MIRGHRSLAAVLMIAVSLALGVPSRAEVSAEIAGLSAYVVVVAIIEDPDPIPLIIWEPVRDIDPSRILNADGGPRGDGRPDADYDPIAGRPAVVWAFNAGVHHDIVFAEWLGDAWGSTSRITTGVENEIDPRIFIEDNGTAHVVWWVPGSPTPLRYVVRAAGSSTWSAPQALTPPGASGRRPSVAIVGGELVVAYERNAAGGQEVVVARRSGVAWSTTVVASTPRLEALDPVLHLENGTLWVDWKHAIGVVAYSRFGGTWSAPAVVPWLDPSWFGEQDARALVRQAVLGN
jgi:hypothetical protein